MSEIKVNKVSPRSGTGVQLGDAGDTITVPASANLTVGGTLTASAGGGIANAALSNSAITINGSAVSLGGSVTIGETKPTVTGVSPSTITNDATNITITGTNFVTGASVEIVSTTGAIIVPSTVSYSNATTLVANVTITTDAQFFIRVENPDGNAGRSSSAILTTSDAPVFNTAAGSIGNVEGNFSGTVFSLSASGDTVVFSEVSDPLVLTGGATKANCALSTSGVITTSDFGGNSTTPTTYNFTIRITDAQNQTADRTYSLTSTFGATGGAQFN